MRRPQNSRPPQGGAAPRRTWTRPFLAGVTVLLGATTYATASAVAPVAHTATAASRSAEPTHVGPDKVAWYDASRASAATPPAPMAGVGAKDLLVEGLTINTALLPISLPVPPIRQVTAFVALSFNLPHGATPASLTLRLTGGSTAALAKHLPSGVTPIACPVTSAFKSGLQQPTSAAPTYDCSKRSTVGQLSATGNTVTFPGISRLLTGNRLSLVILPGSLGVERLVLSPPNRKTLSLLSFGSPPTISPPTIPPVPSPAASAGGPGAAAVNVPPIPPAPAITAPAVVPSSPVIASAPPTPGLAALSLSKPDDHRERTAAIGMLVALIAAVGWLTATEHGKRAPATEYGVGRFRSSRTGPPPTI
ncbi:MAG TPA: hypothetical protein VG650_01195 [Mycobacteriales bacterium]|nr:hypothetical protein [Mycobacteriales bacterium]